jgi:DNA-binding transcriptional ArsR family regulator
VSDGRIEQHQQFRAGRTPGTPDQERHSTKVRREICRPVVKGPDGSLRGAAVTRDEALRAFNAKKLAAMDRVRRDPRLTGATRAVGGELLSRLDARTGEVLPTDETYLKDKLGLGLRTVKRAIAALLDTGYFEVRKAGRSNRYRPVLDPEKQVPKWPLSETPQVPKWPLSEADRGQNGPEQVPKSAENRGQNGPPITLEKTLSLPLQGGEAASAPEGAGGPPPKQDLERLRARLKQRLGEEVFASWFGEKLTGASLAPDAVTLILPNQFHANHVKTHFETAVLECVRADHPEILRLVAIAAKPASPARPEHPDARWLVDEGVPLVGEAMGYAPDKAAAAIWGWLKRCGDDPSGLRRIIADAAARQLAGAQFRDVLQAGTRELRFKDQTKLPLNPVAVKLERKAS